MRRNEKILLIQEINSTTLKQSGIWHARPNIHRLPWRSSTTYVPIHLPLFFLQAIQNKNSSAILWQRHIYFGRLINI